VQSIETLEFTLPQRLIDDPQAGEIRAHVLTIAAQLENLSYWLDCIERRHEWLEKAAVVRA
jgi:hypothetical protein